MKRQLFRSKYGFTLFELMIVIAILGIFYAATAGFDWRPQSDMEKSDRMIIAISGLLRTEVQNMAIGKMPKRDGKIASQTVLTIGTGGIFTSYLSGATGVMGSGAFANPYFDGDTKYTIRDVTWTGSSSGFKGTGQVLIDPTGITFSGASIAPTFYLLEIKVGYGLTFSRKITFDKRTGKISETKW